MATDGNSKEKGDRLRRTYQAAGCITREKIARDEPLHEEALRAVEASDIVVVTGMYDRVQQVLEALDLRFTTIQPEQLGRIPLRPEQLLVINCPGQVKSRAIPVVRDFVARGGSLFTTDWALRHVVEPAFPGLVEYNERPTGDDVVRIEVKPCDNPFLKGVLEEGDDPQWWLEGSSYPIRVLDPSRVEVLITSRELGDRYGEAPVAILFKHGDGEVFHMISHYYLQRTELRSERHAAPAASYAAEQGVAVDQGLSDAMDGLSLGEVEAATSSSRFLANIISEKKRAMARWAGRDK